mgnify:CR=1 FL=1
MGGTGFLGINLILALKRKFNNFEITSASRKKTLLLKSSKNIKFVIGDFSKKSILKKKLKNKNFDIVINLGGNIQHKNKSQTVKSHFKLCKNLVDNFKSKIELFVQIGSSMEYGTQNFPNKESDKCFPKSNYGKSKFKSTNYLKKSNLRYIILRPYQVYGPYQKINRLIPSSINYLLRGEQFNSSSGDQLRDFLYVDDFTNLVVKILKNKKTPVGIYNVGTGIPTSIRSVLEKIKSQINKGNINYGSIEMRNDETKILYPNIRKIKKIFKWSPKTSLSLGIKKTIKFYEKQ